MSLTNNSQGDTQPHSNRVSNSSTSAEAASLEQSLGNQEDSTDFPKITSAFSSGSVSSHSIVQVGPKTAVSCQASPSEHGSDIDSGSDSDSQHTEAVEKPASMQSESDDQSKVQNIYEAGSPYLQPYVDLSRSRVMGPKPIVVRDKSLSVLSSACMTSSEREETLSADAVPPPSKCAS